MKKYIEDINWRSYYLFITIIIILMFMGMFASFSLLNTLHSYHYLRLLLISILSVVLLLYPMKSTFFYRIAIMTIGSIYFYTLFFLYPETWSSFIFICFIPAISILFFDVKLFYFSLTFNGILYFLSYLFILFVYHNDLFDFMKTNIVGNMVNFIGSQVIFYFIFLLFYNRAKKQQSYFEQIQQSERLRMIGQLAATVAHEIRNPLTVVKGFMQLYEQDDRFTQDVKQNLSLMIEELNRTEHIISNFLMVGKPNELDGMESVNVTSAMESAMDFVHSYGMINNIDIQIDVIDDCHIMAREMEIKQLLINLVKNSIEASSSGDSIIIRAKKNKKNIEIQIIDKGVGMTEEEISALGVPFYSLESKGTGLGLMVCYHIVERYKGTIKFTSEVGKGTTVALIFPTKES